MGRESKFIFIYSYVITKNSICNESLVESIFQTAGKAWTMLKSSVVHFVLSSGFNDTVRIVRLEIQLNWARSVLPAILRNELARIATLSFSVVLSRKKNFAVYSFTMQEIIWKENLPLSVPQGGRVPWSH